MKKLFTVAIVANAVAILVSGMAAVKAASLTPLGTFGNTEPGWRMPDEVLPGDTPDTTDGSGFYAYLQPSTLERGLAYNPTTGNLILVSRPNGRRHWLCESGIGHYQRRYLYHQYGWSCRRWCNLCQQPDNEHIRRRREFQGLPLGQRIGHRAGRCLRWRSFERGGHRR